MDERRNASGYIDPTAYIAISNLEQEEKAYRKLLKTILYISSLAGFKIEGRLVLTNLKSGRTYK